MGVFSTKTSILHLTADQMASFRRVSAAGSPHEFCLARELAGQILNAANPFSARPWKCPRGQSGLSVKTPDHGETGRSHGWRRGPAGRWALLFNFFIRLNRFSVGFPPLAYYKMPLQFGPFNLDCRGIGFVPKGGDESLFPGNADRAGSRYTFRCEFFFDDLPERRTKITGPLPFGWGGNSGEFAAFPLR